jgi:cation:H+ antiporter
MEWFIIVLTLTGLAVGGHCFVIGAAAIGNRCGMSPVLVGATIVAFGTSLPEWGISVTAAWRGFTELSIGNVVGSNVCNVCLTLGLAAVLSPIRVPRDSLTHDGLLMLFATGLLLLVSIGGTIKRAEGVLLLVIGIGATVYFVVKRRENSDTEAHFHWWDLPQALLALVLVLLCSHYFVEAVGSLAQQLGISEWTIGVTIAAIGTSLPELVTTLVAVFHKQTGLVIGTALGSSTFNILFVLGSAASVQPLRIMHFELLQAGIFMGLMIVVLGFLWSTMKIARWEGATLVALGVVWYLLDLST